MILIPDRLDFRLQVHYKTVAPQTRSTRHLHDSPLFGVGKTLTLLLQQCQLAEDLNRRDLAALAAKAFEIPAYF